MITSELRHKDRIVFQNSFALAVVPFAATSPFNVWVLPIVCHARFEEASAELIAAVGEALGHVLRKLHTALDEPDYNVVLRNPPLSPSSGAGSDPFVPFTSWFVEITPRLGAGRLAGFEMGSGMHSNGNVPDHDAARLREAPL